MRNSPGQSANDTPRKRGGRALALVPLGTAVLFGALLYPWGTEPRDVPLPLVDGRALARARHDDQELARSAEATPLPVDIRAVGSALRAFRALQAEGAPDTALAEARGSLDAAVTRALPLGQRAFAQLRAAQTETFVRELARFEMTGEESRDLVELAGGFVRRMTDVGWAARGKVLLDEDARRIAYKLAWNADVGREASRGLEPSLDETRALYAFYVTHPHPSEAARRALAAAARGAASPAACEALVAGEELAREDWRLEKIRALGAIDPEYPTAFAAGVSHYRRGRYTAAADSFRAWLEAHPDGPLTLRAQNHLRAAVRAEQRAP